VLPCVWPGAPRPTQGGTLEGRAVGGEDSRWRGRPASARRCDNPWPVLRSPVIDRNCLLLKFSEKISEPVGHGLLKDVLFTEAPSDSVLNMAY
jgi:hypothetical protein